MRFILIDDKRVKAIEKYERFGDPEGGFFNTNTGNNIMFSIEPEITKISRKKTLPDRFNHLLAMTYSLTDSADIWIYDNEGILYMKICYVKQSINLSRVH